MELFRFKQGSGPLLVSMPHVGTYVPDLLLRRMMPIARTVPDTDWHLEKLYDFAGELGASVLAATHSRYVVDLNRPPDNANLYPGQDTTGLCPIDTFAKRPIYRMGGSHGHPALDRRAIQQTPVLGAVVRGARVDRRAVVPHDEVADLPLVPVAELRAHAMRMQLSDERTAFIAR